MSFSSPKPPVVVQGPDLSALIAQQEAAEDARRRQRQAQSRRQGRGALVALKDDEDQPTIARPQLGAAAQLG